MEKFTCEYCSKEFSKDNAWRNHARLCKNNPAYKKVDTSKARDEANKKCSCKYCNNLYSTGNIKKHENSCIKNPEVYDKKKKICPVCNLEFFTNSNTCSYSCSNTLFRHANQGGIKYKTDEQLIEKNRYREICFRYHKKECLICNEQNIVEVHHLNENHYDNRPENLVPLCPTHHQYWHSGYKYIIEKTVLQYIEAFISECRP